MTIDEVKEIFARIAAKAAVLAHADLLSEDAAKELFFKSTISIHLMDSLNQIPETEGKVPERIEESLIPILEMERELNEGIYLLLEKLKSPECQECKKCIPLIPDLEKLVDVASVKGSLTWTSQTIGRA